METAARTGDAASFFSLARTALEAAPHTELEAGRGGENDDIRRFLALADEVNYAGLRPTHEEFERWIEFLRDALRRGTLQRSELLSEKLS
jgi:hypothetical protein